MSVPTFHAYFNAEGQQVDKGNSAMFSRKQPRTLSDAKDEALGAIFKLASLTHMAERPKEVTQTIASVGINGGEPISLVELAAHVEAGDYKFGCVRDYSARWRAEHPNSNPIRDVIAPIFPQFKNEN